MEHLNKKTLFLAQLIKEAGKIESEKQLSKMLCYIGMERGKKTGFKFNKDHRFGHYTFEIKEERKKLQEQGLIEYHIEKSRGIWGEDIERHVFVATEKLKNLELPISEREKRAVHSIYREYSGYTPKEIENYDHNVYREGRTRTEVEARKDAMKKTKQLMAKHKGNEKAALEEWLSV